MMKKIGSIVVFILAAILLVYSASRSLDFIALTLPPDKRLLAWAGLAALDGGLVAWTLSFLYGSKGWQRAISLLLILVDMAGAVLMFAADTLYGAGANGLTKAFDPNQMQAVIMALSGIIGLNIAATVFHHITDPAKLREMSEEAAFEKVEEQTMKQIERNAEQLAAQLAPTLAADWMRQTQARYMANVGTANVGKILDLPAQDVTPAPVMPVVIPQTQNGFTFGALWRQLFKNGSGRKFEFVSPIPPVVKPTEADAPAQSFTDPAPAAD